jgi:deoxyribose-phosphate aldolase
MNSNIDHTNLKPFSTKYNIIELCNEAIEHNFASVCVNPCYVSLASEILSGSNVAVCTVIGFPLGANTTETKVFEAKNAVENGADEIDMVINIGALKNKDYKYIKDEIESIRDAIEGKILKVIIETCYLDNDEIIKMTKICNETFVNFIKTSTGFGTEGATIENVKLMKKHASETLEIKASGGIKTYEDAVSFLEAGATRLGTSSGVLLMKGDDKE